VFIVFFIKITAGFKLYRNKEKESSEIIIYK